MRIPEWLLALLHSFASGMMFAAWLVFHKDVCIYLAILNAIISIYRVDRPNDMD